MELKNIKKKYGDFELDIDLNINKGEIFGLIGKSGSGKSSILKIIQGIIKADSGDVLIDSKINTSYVFQDFNLLYNKTVFQNVELALILKKVNDKKSVEKVLKFVGLEDKKDLYISALSGGEKQRVAIARSLVSKPDLLLCDEVTASLDDIVKNEILSVFERINKEYGVTILMVTHELDVAKRMCDRVAVIENGKIIETFKVSKESSKNKGINYLEYAKEVLK